MTTTDTDTIQELDRNIARFANNQKAAAHLDSAERILNSAHHVLGLGVVTPELRGRINNLKRMVSDAERDLNRETGDLARAMMKPFDLPKSPLERFRAAIDDAAGRFPDIVFNVDIKYGDGVMWVTLPLAAGFEDDEVTTYLDAINVVLDMNEFGSIGHVKHDGIEFVINSHSFHDKDGLTLEVDIWHLRDRILGEVNATRRRT